MHLPKPFLGFSIQVKGSTIPLFCVLSSLRRGTAARSRVRRARFGKFVRNPRIRSPKLFHTCWFPYWKQNIKPFDESNPAVDICSLSLVVWTRFKNYKPIRCIIRRYRGKPTFSPYQHCTGPTFNPTTCTATQGSQIWYSNLATAQAPFGHPASSPHRWHPGSPQHGASSASWSRPANEKMLEIRCIAGLEYTHVSFKYS